MDQSPSGSNANTSRRPKIVRSSSNHELIRTLLMNQPDSTQFSTISKPSDALAPREHSAAGVNSYSNSSRRIGNVPPLRTPNSSKSHGGLRTSTSTASSGKCPHCNVTLKWPNGLRKHVEVCQRIWSIDYHQSFMVFVKWVQTCWLTFNFSCREPDTIPMLNDCHRIFITEGPRSFTVRGVHLSINQNRNWRSIKMQSITRALIVRASSQDLNSIYHLARRRQVKDSERFLSSTLIEIPLI